MLIVLSVKIEVEAARWGKVTFRSSLNGKREYTCDRILWIFFLTFARDEIITMTGDFDLIIKLHFHVDTFFYLFVISIIRNDSFFKRRLLITLLIIDRNMFLEIRDWRNEYQRTKKNIRKIFIENTLRYIKIEVYIFICYFSIRLFKYSW